MSNWTKEKGRKKGIGIPRLYSCKKIEVSHHRRPTFLFKKFPHQYFEKKIYPPHQSRKEKKCFLLVGVRCFQICGISKILKWFEMGAVSLSLSILLSFDKGCWKTVFRAIIVIKTYYQKWVMIKIVLSIIMITGESKNYPGKYECVLLWDWWRYKCDAERKGKR